MHFPTPRWATAVAAAALIALPGAVLAQSTPAQDPPSQLPTQSQPPTPPAQPAQPPAAQTPPATPPSSASQPPSGQGDTAAAKQHLGEARDALSQLTSMPEAARLQGDARTQVSQLISNFNALITAQNGWRSTYAKVDDNLKTLLGPDTDQAASGSPTGMTGTAGSTATAGTSGTTGAPGAAAAASPGMQLDPAVRAKLVEFRTHLKEFEKAAGGSQPASEPSPSAAPSGAMMPPSAATGTTSNPATPATAASGAAPPTSPGPTGTTGTAEQNANAAAQSELAAIDAILSKSKTGALTKAQTAEIRRHLDALRALLK
jgi:pilus assembly protein FimV